MNLSWTKYVKHQSLNGVEMWKLIYEE